MTLHPTPDPDAATPWLWDQHDRHVNAGASDPLDSLEPPDECDCDVDCGYCGWEDPEGWIK